MLAAPDTRPARLLGALAVVAAALLPLAAATPALAASDPAAGRTVVGELIQAWPESAHDQVGEASAPLSWVQPEHGKAVRLDTADLADVPAGATVRVTVGGAVADPADPGQFGTAHAVTDSRVLAAPSTATQGSGTASGTATVQAASATAPVGLTDEVTVATILPAGGVLAGSEATDAAILNQVVAAVNGPVAQFWADQTDGAIHLGVTATHPLVRTTASCADPTALWQEAAATVGFVPDPGHHLVLYVDGTPSSVAGCAYGLAQVGDGMHGAGALYVRDAIPSLIAHELGHNFGLGHSSERQCDGVVDAPAGGGGGCTTQPYRDYYDVMGASWEHVGTLDVAQAARLGILPASQQRAMTSSGPGGTVTLAPLSGRSGVRGLRLTAADGSDYWLEYRAASGQDAWLATPANRFGLQAGVLVHRVGGMPDTALLLDGTPSPAAGWAKDLQSALPVGSPVALDGFTVTVGSLGPAGATLTVTPDPATAAAGRATAQSATPATLPSSRCTSRCPAGTPSAGTGSTGVGTAGSGPAGTRSGKAVAPAVDRPVAAPAGAPSSHAPAVARVDASAPRPVHVVLAASMSSLPGLLAAGTGSLAGLGAVVLALRRWSTRRAAADRPLA